MPKNMTVYNLLISCPSDVANYVQTIEKIISDFNSVYAQINDSYIVTKHWGKDSYTESGGTPQELLNGQFVLDSDVAVAIFWTKFGTPTKKYNSGTEEEIETLLAQGKQVFMYFLEIPIPPSEVDSEQYGKVKEFKNKYADKGIYYVVHGEDEFRRKFTNDLAKYFMPIISGEDKKNDHSKLLIEDSCSNDRIISANKFNFHDSKFLNELFEKCENIIQNINDIHLERKHPSNSTNINSKIGIELPGELQSNPVIITNEIKEALLQFFKINKIQMTDSFFEVGGLKQRENFVAFSGSNYFYYGTQDEKQKHELIQQLYESVKEYNEYFSFFDILDNYSFISCALVNDGNTFDEDIDVRLYFPKNTVISPKKFPIPGENIIEKLDDMEFLEDFLYLTVDDETIEYDNYPDAIPKRIPQNFEIFPSHKEYDEYKLEYVNDLERIMCFEVFEKEENVVFRFKIKSLKQHDKMLFPSKIFLNNYHGNLKYKISSKHSSRVIEGDLVIK